MSIKQPNLAMKCQIWHLAMFTHINKPDTFAPARNSYGQSSSVQALRKVIIGAISVNGAAPIIRVEIHRQIDVHTFRYRKIPKISPGAYIFQRPFLRGLFLGGLMYGGSFAFQNRFR